MSSLIMVIDCGELSDLVEKEVVAFWEGQGLVVLVSF